MRGMEGGVQWRPCRIMGESQGMCARVCVNGGWGGARGHMQGFEDCYLLHLYQF